MMNVFMQWNVHSLVTETISKSWKSIFICQNRMCLDVLFHPYLPLLKCGSYGVIKCMIFLIEMNYSKILFIFYQASEMLRVDILIFGKSPRGPNQALLIVSAGDPEYP